MYERNDLRDWVSPSERWWLLLSTDRTTYRTTDTIHAWGLLRSRDDGTVPAQVSIRLRSTDASEDSGPWLAQTSARPTARGTWAVDLPLSNVPYGDYIVDVRTAGAVVGSVWVGVRDIRKPAYSLDVTVDRHAVLAGDPISATAQVKFFDGTPSAGLALLH